MENFLSSATANGVDVSHPSFAQIRQLVTLQQQHRQGQVALNPAAAASAPPPVAHNPQAAAQVQKMLAAMQQSAKQKELAMMTAQPAVSAPQATDSNAAGPTGKPKIWSGYITTPASGAQNQSSCKCLGF